MPFQSAPQCAEARVLFDLNDGSKRAGFSLYARKASGDWTESDLSLFADAVSDAVIADLIPALSDDHSFVGVIAKDLEDEFPLRVENLQETPVPGEVASPALPNATAVVGTWIGAAGSAPRRGRIYLPSPAESQVDGNVLTAGADTALTAAVAALRTALEPITGVAGSSQAIVSRYSGSTVIGTTSGGREVKEATKRLTAIVNGVDNFRVSSRVDSQRRRAPRESA